MLTSTLAGLLLGCSGLGALRVGWRRPGMAARRAVVAGWLLLLVGIYACTRTWGGEFGISYALAGLTLVALLLVAQNVELRPGKPDKAVSRSSTPTSTSHKWLTFVAAGPLAGIAGCQLTLVLTHSLPGTELNNMAIAAVLFPSLWGILAYLSCLMGRPGRQVLGFTLVAAVTSAILYL